jgi:hypothetical protein
MPTIFDQALAELRRKQMEGWASLGIVARAVEEDSLGKALRRADQREKQSTERDGFIYDGLKYPAGLERQRWARTREIIARVSPGPGEDGRYLEMLARQAASVEMVLRGDIGGKPMGRGAEVCERVLLGTVPSIRSDAYSRTFANYYFVLVEAGLIEFVYQLAKASVLSWRPKDPASPAVQGGGRAQYSYGTEPADIDVVLAANSYPMRLFARTLNAYIFEGRPRDEGFSPPSEAYLAPLTILTNMNERFILAHEYGHTLIDVLDVQFNDDSAWREEFSADIVAFRVVIESGRVLDGLPPPFAIYGSFFVLTALEIIRRTLDIVRYGAVQKDAGSASHPPFMSRLENLRRLYLEHVSSTNDENSIRPALAPARTLEYLWELVAKEVTGEWRSGRVPHEIWNSFNGSAL